MSLAILFDEDTVNAMKAAWPGKPAVSPLPDDSPLPGIANAHILHKYLATGTAPADQTVVIRDGAALHPRAYTTLGHLDPVKLAKWRDRGYSVQLRNINRWYPPLHTVCSRIQTETGFGCYVAGFITPAGAQGLNHHWDQSAVLVYQLAGRKTWRIWEPVVEEPHRDHLASNTQPASALVDQLKAAGPDHEFDLSPGQVLTLPRGCLHNPHTRGHRAESTHLTFVLRERTGYWISEKLTQAAIASTPLRRVIPPEHIVDPATLAEHIDQTRNHLIDWLTRIDPNTFAVQLLAAARTEPDRDYL